jgi:hypothetical protein
MRKKLYLFVSNKLKYCVTNFYLQGLEIAGEKTPIKFDLGEPGDFIA